MGQREYVAHFEPDHLECGIIGWRPHRFAPG
jgi:hypothetical protein